MSFIAQRLGRCLALSTFDALSFTASVITNLKYYSLAQQMSKKGKVNPTMVAILNRIHGSEIQNQLFGTPVLTVADVLAAEQQKIRQMMLSFGKGGSVAPNVRL